MKQQSKFLIYLLSGLFSFLLFLWWTFPYKALENDVIRRISEKIQNPYRLKIEKTTSGLFGGFSFKNFEILKEDKTKDLTVLKIPTLQVDLSLLKLLQKKTSVSFQLKFGSGSLKGKFQDAPEQSDLELNFNRLNPADFQTLNNLYGIQLRGEIEGKASFRFPKRGEANAGETNLELNNFVLESIPIPALGMTLPKMNLTGSKNSRRAVRLNRNTFEIQEFRLQGDLELDLTGRVDFTSLSFDQGLLNLEGKLKVSPIVAKLVPLFALVENQKNPDGSYPLRITGPASRPSVFIGTFRIPM